MLWTCGSSTEFIIHIYRSRYFEWICCGLVAQVRNSSYTYMYIGPDIVIINLPINLNIYCGYSKELASTYNICFDLKQEKYM